jgi:hypothetical protein
MVLIVAPIVAPEPPVTMKRPLFTEVPLGSPLVQPEIVQVEHFKVRKYVFWAKILRGNRIWRQKFDLMKIAKF